MSANITLSGFPPVIRLKFFQGSTEKPGRCIIDTMVVGPSALTQLPRFANLTINTTNFTGYWANMRVVKAPRVRAGYTRVVLEDNRWLLRETVLDKNYNERDSLGHVLTERKKTIEELGEILAEATGLAIQTGQVPSFEPGAKWAGETADVALGKMLRQTGCRFVYNPVAPQSYTIASGNTGYDLTSLWTQRLYRPGPPATLAIVNVKTAPVLYEDTMDCRAIQINTDTGAVEDQADIILPTSPTEALGQTRFRLWEPTVTHPVATDADDVLMLDHRAKAHLFDPESPMHERARIKRDEFDRYPHHQPLYTPGQNVPRLIELTGGGRAFLTDHPVLLTDSAGDLLTDCKLVSSYYIKEDVPFAGKVLKRWSEPIILTGAGTDELDVIIDWLKPVSSTLPDMSESVWDNLHLDVTDAIKAFWEGDASTIRLSAPADLKGSGQVGAVMYELNSRLNMTKVMFQVAINFTPGDEGAIH